MTADDPTVLRLYDRLVHQGVPERDAAVMAAGQVQANALDRVARAMRTVTPEGLIKATAAKLGIIDGE